MYYSRTGIYSVLPTIATQKIYVGEETRIDYGHRTTNAAVFEKVTNAVKRGAHKIVKCRTFAKHIFNALRSN